MHGDAEELLTLGRDYSDPLSVWGSTKLFALRTVVMVATERLMGVRCSRGNETLASLPQTEKLKVPPQK